MPQRATVRTACCAVIGPLAAVLCWTTGSTFRRHRHGWPATAVGTTAVTGLVLLAGVLIGAALMARRRPRRAAWAVVAAAVALLGASESLVLGSYPLTSDEGRLCFVAIQAETRQPVDPGGRAVLRRAAALPDVRPELRRAATDLSAGVAPSDIEARLLRWCLH